MSPGTTGTDLEVFAAFFTSPGRGGESSSRVRGGPNGGIGDVADPRLIEFARG